ncbi:hypothetical protein BJ684DRAFT_20992 [Piptocephalis cylindrospora]|uniref:Uncharacterized protein n=1 Tax=Piptocephalis cylindrospora TaxID=1907219 RepID=A0A4P9Y1R0_9FUNG|nr:hypothetical protein BJ684DRAFT_20992 [Piptocephalis cylindrospora]|eukprot:RKP12472.1 hypothetical protein BJ684DRAFT_20992 [Piptocephalis cylindrospora]
MSHMHAAENKIKGKTQQNTGAALGNHSMEARGYGNHAAGHAQKHQAQAHHESAGVTDRVAGEGEKLMGKATNNPVRETKGEARKQGGKMNAPPGQETPPLSPLIPGTSGDTMGTMDVPPQDIPKPGSHGTIPIVLVAIAVIILVILLFGWACYRKYRTQFLDSSTTPVPMAQNTQTTHGPGMSLQQQQQHGGGYFRPTSRTNSYDADPVPPYPTDPATASDTIVQVGRPNSPVPQYSSPRETMRKEAEGRKQRGNVAETTVQDDEGEGRRRRSLDCAPGPSSSSPMPQSMSSHGRRPIGDIVPPSPPVSYDRDAVERHWQQKQRCDTPPTTK